MSCPSHRGPGGPLEVSGAFATDHLTTALHCKLAAVVHQEAARAAELVRLHRNHLDGELFVGQVSAGQLEALRHISVDLVATRSVVVGGHRLSHSHFCIAPGVTPDGAISLPAVAD